jgi:hypothetical protein
MTRRGAFPVRRLAIAHAMTVPRPSTYALVGRPSRRDDRRCGPGGKPRRRCIVAQLCRPRRCAPRLRRHATPSVLAPRPRPTRQGMGPLTAPVAAAAADSRPGSAGPTELARSDCRSILRLSERYLLASSSFFSSLSRNARRYASVSVPVPNPTAVAAAGTGTLAPVRSVAVVAVAVATVGAAAAAGGGTVLVVVRTLRAAGRGAAMGRGSRAGTPMSISPRPLSPSPSTPVDGAGTRGGGTTSRVPAVSVRRSPSQSAKCGAGTGPGPDPEGLPVRDRGAGVGAATATTGAAAAGAAAAGAEAPADGGTGPLLRLGGRRRGSWEAAGAGTDGGMTVGAAGASPTTTPPPLPAPPAPLLRRGPTAPGANEPRRAMAGAGPGSAGAGGGPEAVAAAAAAAERAMASRRAASSSAMRRSLSWMSGWSSDVGMGAVAAAAAWSCARSCVFIVINKHNDTTGARVPGRPPVAPGGVGGLRAQRPRVAAAVSHAHGLAAVQPSPAVPMRVSKGRMAQSGSLTRYLMLLGACGERLQQIAHLRLQRRHIGTLAVHNARAVPLPVGQGVHALVPAPPTTEAYSEAGRRVLGRRYAV